MDTPSNPLQQSSLTGLRRRKSTKWQTFPADVLPLFIAELDVPLAAPVADALHAAVDLSDTGYAMGWGDQEYAAALDGFARRHWDWQVPAERTALVPDVMLGIVEMLKLITSPGDAVVVNPPVYPPFYAFVTTMDRRVVEAPLTPGGRLDPAALDAAFGDAAAYLLCSPHNPTGAVHTADELAAVADLAARHGVRVVADEIHAPLVLPGSRFVPYLSLPGTERAFSVLSASKAWNLAGLKAAMAVAGADAAEDLARVPEVVGHGPSHFGVIAHAAAFRHGDDWLAALLAGLDENRRLLAELLKEHLPQVGYRGHEGTYLAWLDCRDLGLGENPARAFLDRGRVALAHGPEFGTGGAGHVRLNLGTTPGILEEAVRRMASSL